MQITKSSDVILGIFVIAITALLLISIPTGLLDLLIVLNIAISLLLLSVSLFIPNSSALLSFPSLLLLTTLFRLGLNVASTRLILLQGFAGDVIQSFGMFLVQGEVVVGIIIFCIITVVNFIVIARGSSRVAEVAARFALDALPGKQMAIDSDMRAGLISAYEANQKREELRRESQLYGNMDGAMKFVQGDAIAGFVIIFTNILGGIYRGVSQGSSFTESVQTYTILTIGDGLVSQIPALLISICAGIVITRISSSSSATLGSDVGAQLLGRPGPLYLAGAILMLLGMFPDLPILPFWAGGLLFLGLGFLVQRGTLVVNETNEVNVGKGRFNLVEYSPSGTLQLPAARQLNTPLVVHIDSSFFGQNHRYDIDRFSLTWNNIRQEFESESGLALSEASLKLSDQVGACGYRVMFNEIEITRGKLRPDHMLIEGSKFLADMIGLGIEVSETHPLSGGTCFWTRRSNLSERLSSVVGLTICSHWEWISFEICAFFRNHSEEVLTLSIVQERLRQIEQNSPALMEEVFGKKMIDASRLTEVLQRFAREGGNVGNLQQLLEHIAAYYANYKLSNGTYEFESAEIVGFLRQRLSRALLSGVMSSRSTLKSIILSKEVENLFEDLNVTKDALSKLDRVERFRLIEGLRVAMHPIKDRGVLPVLIICSSDLRATVSDFVLQHGVGVQVAAELEIAGGITVERVGEWRL